MSRSANTSSSSSRSGATNVHHACLPYVGYRHVMMFLIASAIILQSILVAGCTSEGLSSIFLFSLAYTNSAPQQDSSPIQVNSNASSVLSTLAGNGTSLQIRAGYFGICMTTGNGWICSRSSEQLSSLIQRSETGDPLNLLFAAEKFKSEAVFVGLWFISIAFAASTFCLLWTGFGLGEDSSDDGSERNVRPSKVQVIGAGFMIFSTFMTSIMALLSGIWQHMASSTAVTMTDTFTYGTAIGGVGAGAMALGWTSFSLQAITSMGLMMMVLASHLLKTHLLGK